jgi:hypothetical protein
VELFGGAKAKMEKQNVEWVAERAAVVGSQCSAAARQITEEVVRVTRETSLK